MTEGKKKHVTLSIREKLTVLKKIAGGASLASIAKEYGIGKSSVSDIKKNEEKLKKFASGMENFSVDSKSRKIMCLANDDELDQALFSWFVQERSQNIPVSGPLLTGKALQLHALLHVNDMESAPEFKKDGFGGFVTSMLLGSCHYREKSCHLVNMRWHHLKRIFSKSLRKTKCDRI